MDSSTGEGAGRAMGLGGALQAFAATVEVAGALGDGQLAMQLGDLVATMCYFQDHMLRHLLLQRNVVLKVVFAHELEQIFEAWILGGHEECFPAMCLTCIGNDLKGVYFYRLGHSF